MNILQDIKTAANMFCEVRKARKAGANSIRVRVAHTIPIYDLAPSFYNTIEGGLTWKLGRDTSEAVRTVFKGFPYETQRRLEFTPENPGEWAERARFWQQQLKPVLPPKEHHAVMALFIGWYAHCLRMRKEAAV